MLTPAERFKGWIDSLSEAWKGRLSGWLADVTLGALSKFLDKIEDETRDEALASLGKIRDIPNLPPEFKALADRAESPAMPQAVVAIIPYLVGMIIGTAMGAARPIANWMSYPIEKLIHSFRLDPYSVITAWRRDKPAYEKYFDDLRDQGWTDERIEALKFYTLFYPAPADLIRWQAREVFEPEMIARYGLDSEFEAIEKEPFYKAGMTDEQILNYWRAHWEHASWMQVVEMLHRGLLTEEQVYDWFRVVEIPPFWRDLLIQTAYTWPTRVDVRRWWDMRTIDETELRRLYSGMGYRGVNLDNYILWTKVYVAFPDLMARWTNGWITEDDVRSELTALGMPAARVEEMIQTKKKSVEAGQVDEGKALTKTEIYKGVREERITRDQAIDLLVDLNYNLAQAGYLLDVNVAVAAGSPETYEEFKDLTTKYKIAIGKAEKPMPEELIKAGQEVVRLTGEVEALERSIEEEERGLIPGEVLPEVATVKRDELRVALHRAQAELARVKTEYEAKVAEWRHG